MSSKQWLTAAMVVVVMTSGSVAFAQTNAEPTDAEKSAELVEQLGTAAQLVAFGRGELAEATGLKDYKSPEALVAAGAIYLRAHKATGGKLKPSDAKVQDADGTTVAEEGQPLSLGEEAEALFDEARAMPLKDNAALETLIKQAQSGESRGATGGPRVINRSIKTGKTHNIEIAFDPKSPASVTMRSSGKTQFEVVGNKGRVLWHSKGTWGFYNWHPGNGGLSNVTVRVINGGGPSVSYTVTTN